MSKRTSYLTPAEVESIQHLHKRAPYAIAGISRGMFSIARHFGGMKYQGCHYAYMPEHDECVRVDVLATVNRARRSETRCSPASPDNNGSSSMALFSEPRSTSMQGGNDA